MKFLSTYIYNVCFTLLFACSVTTVYAKQFVVVIDAGHGGHDYGAIGLQSNEKDINLAVALKLGEYISSNSDDVKVVYTRKTDKYLTLQERANVANNAGGDLFISIHTNSIDKKSPNRTKVCGASTYTLGLHKSNENLEVAKRENSVITLESDYSTKYQGFNPNSTESYIIFEMNQNLHMAQSVEFASNIQKEMSNNADRVDRGVRQAGFWVLAATGMPAVLVELDFICNPQEEKFLISDSGRSKLALSIFKAFEKYKQNIERTQYVKKSKSTKVKNKSKEDDSNVVSAYSESNISEIKTDVDNGDRIIYKIQILTSNSPLKKNDRRLKGISPIDFYADNGLYKYTYGEFETMVDAKEKYNEIKKQFSQAFIVKFKGEKRIK